MSRADSPTPGHVLARRRGSSVVPPSGMPGAVAVCDLGTFSALLLVARTRAGVLGPILEERHTVDLAFASPHSRRLAERGIARAERILRRFNRIAAAHRCSRSLVVCTAALRTASNRREVMRRLRDATPHPVVVITPRVEAMLAARGALSGLRPGTERTVIVDIGGGSTEIASPDARWFRGFPWGAATASSRWRQRRPSRRADCIAWLRHRAAAVVGRGLRGASLSAPCPVGVGGTITSLAAIHAGMEHFDAGRLHGMVLPCAAIAAWAERLALMSERAIAALIPFDRPRARVLTAGTFLWDAVCKRLDAEAVTVSVRGLRWGAADRLASAGTLPFDPRRSRETP